MIITVDRAPVLRAARNMGTLAETHLPASMREALTVIAFRARRAERENADKNIDRAKRFTINSIAARRATDTPDGYESSVFVLPRMSEILSRLEFGGTTDSGIVIRDERLENQFGSLNRRFWPSRLLTNNKKYFEANINGANGIYERTREGNERGLKLALLFVNRPRYDPILGFTDVAIKASDTFLNEAIRQINRRLDRDGFGR